MHLRSKRTPTTVVFAEAVRSKRAPTTVQTAEAVQSAFDIFAMRGPQNSFSGFRSGPLFETPEETAAAQALLVSTAVKQAVDAVEAKYQPILTSMGAELRTLKKPPVVKDEPEELTAKQQLAQLQQKFTAKETKENEARRMSAITEAISAKGIRGEAAADLKARLILDHGAAIKGTETGAVYEDSETGLKTPIAEFLEKTILVGARKDRYLPSGKQGPTKIDRPTNGSNGAVRFYSELTGAEREKLTPTERTEMIQADWQRSKQPKQ